MLRPRLIPVLLVHDHGLVKTRKFTNPTYVGDPLNAVKIFNEKKVDELCIFDIDATRLSRPPEYELIKKLANECRMPICYGGGINQTEQAERIIELGVEKVSISAAAVSNLNLISQTAVRIGSQSVVATMDVKKTGILQRYEVMTHNASCRTGLSPFEFAHSLQENGAGELIINSVDRDGTMNGYDTELIAKIIDKLDIPVTLVGGAGTLTHVSDLWKRFGLVGAAAGSIFVFKGKYRAVLISYPNKKERALLSNKLGELT